MSIKASDLPSDVKGKLLSNIKDQLGASEYERATDAMGEDGLLDMALEQTACAQAKKEKEAEDTKNAWLFWAVLTVAIIGAIVVAAGGYMDSGLKGMAIGAVTGFFTTGMYALMACHILAAIIGLFSNLEAVGSVIAGILGLGFLGFLVYGLWKAVAYAGSGTVTWFQWLFGHF